VLAIPEHAAIQILRVSLELPAVKVAARVVAEVVVKRGLDGPLANENGVCGRAVGLGEVACTVGSVVGVRAANEEVDVRVYNDVGVDVGPVGVPGLRADEAVGDGDGESLRLRAHGFEGGGVVFVEVGDRVLGLAEVVESGQGLVDQRQCEGSCVGLLEDVVGGFLDHFDGEVEIGLVVPPGQLAGLALVVETILSAGQTVQVDDDVHVVLGDGILGNAFHSGKLTASVVVVTGHGWHVCPVANRDAQSVHTEGSERVDVLRGNVIGEPLFQKSTTSGFAQILAKAVFVNSGRSIGSEEIWIDIELQQEPSSKIDTVRLVISPAREGVGRGTRELRAGPLDDLLGGVDENLGHDLQEVRERASACRETKQTGQISFSDRRLFDRHIRDVFE